MPTTHTLDTHWKRPGRLRLRICKGPDAGQELQLDASTSPRILVGRSSVNDLILRDEHVSSSHFELTFPATGTGLHLRDLGSRNGVHVGRDVRVYEADLPPGAKVRVGQSVLELVSLDPIEVELSPKGCSGTVIGASPVMRALFHRLEKIAPTPLPVLITGETGTGKEEVARRLHALSKRLDKPFVSLNCANIPAQLAEAELFGHCRGSFTGAHADKAGLFEAANGGTLFLDELGELPLELQPKLLRALESGEVVRVGEHRPRKVDVRVIAATLRDLRDMVVQEKFREDLYFRIAGIRELWLSLPPLRERVSDIVPLAEFFLGQFVSTFGVERKLSSSAQRALEGHRWPGNVRELRRVLEAAYHLTETVIIGATDVGVGDFPGRQAEWPQIGSERSYECTLDMYREAAERDYLRHLMARPGTFTSKAERAGRTDMGLRKALRRLGMIATPGCISS